MTRPTVPKLAERLAAETPGLADDGYRLEDQMGFRLRKAHQRAAEIFNTVMAEFDVTPTQFAALAKLYDVGEASQNHLGRMTAMDPATVFGVVSRLKKRGLIAQRVDPRDGRVVLLRLSDDGLSTVADMRAKAVQVTERIRAPLTDDEAEAFLALLEKLGNGA